MTVPVFRRPPVLVMETGVNQVPGGTVAGWVSGTPAGLPAGGAVVDCVFDLGPDWDQYTVLQVSLNVALSVAANWSIANYGSDTAAANTARRQSIATAATGSTASLVATVNNLAYLLRPIGRYQIVKVANVDASNAAGPAAKVTISAYPA